jgi:hypothetical protein
MFHIRAAEDDLNTNLEVYVKGRYRVVLMFNCANQILKRQTSRFHYGSKVPVVTITVLITILEKNRSTYTWSKNNYFNSLSLILVRCTKIGYDVTCSKNGVTCKQTRTQMSKDTLESHIIDGLKGK